MSKHVQSARLCAFPSFDKCDSLVYFPTSMTRFFNSNDFASLRKLFTTHMDKNCKVNIKGIMLTAPKYIDVMENLEGLYPDKISCVHETKVKDNTIYASVYCKFTENATVYDSVARVAQTRYADVFPLNNRVERWIKKLNISEHDQRYNSMHRALVSANDLIVYGVMKYEFQFDNYSRRIVRMKYNFVVTSVNEVTFSDEHHGTCQNII